MRNSMGPNMFLGPLGPESGLCGVKGFRIACKHLRGKGPYWSRIVSTFDISRFRVCFWIETQGFFGKDGNPLSPKPGTLNPKP